MENEDDLECEGPDDKQLVILIKILPIKQNIPPLQMIIFLDSDNFIIYK